MSRPEVVVVSTGCANLASVLGALQRVGADAWVTSDPGDVLAAPGVVLPGVGHFGPAMRGLRARGMDRAIVERVRARRPLLAICLGMQLLCESSEESPEEAGLGLVPGCVARFAGDVRVPQMGWNRIVAEAGCKMLRSDWMYFANSFRLQDAPAGWRAAVAEHGGPFVAAVERGSVLACQFHPELSGAAGLGLLGRWMARVGAGEVSPC